MPSPEPEETLRASVEAVLRDTSVRRHRSRADREQQVEFLRATFGNLLELARVMPPTDEASAAASRAPGDRQGGYVRGAYILGQLEAQLEKGIAQLLNFRDLLEKDGVAPLHRLPAKSERCPDPVAPAPEDEGVPSLAPGDARRRLRAVFPLVNPEGWLVVSKGGAPAAPASDPAPQPVPRIALPEDVEALPPADRFDADLADGVAVEVALGRYVEALAAANGYLPIRVRSRDDQRNLRQIEHEAIAAALEARGEGRLAVDGRLAELRNLVTERDWSTDDPTEDLDRLRPLAFLWFAVVQAADGDRKALDHFCRPRLRREDVEALGLTLSPQDRSRLLGLIPRLPPNAFLHLFSASEILGRRAGEGPLRDWLCGVKDVFCLGPTTAASAILEDFSAAIEATAVTRLRRAGCLFPGKTNLDEFALGSLNESSAFKPTPGFPGHRIRVAGGSSGGSAAAVAAGLVRFAIGSDTAGSIRVPSSFCGVVGWKPSYGIVSRYGLLPLSMGLDVVGTLTRDVEDAIEVASVLVGADPKDETTRGVPAIDFAAAVKELGDRRLTVGVPIEYFLNVDSEKLPLYGHLVDCGGIEAFDEMRRLPDAIAAVLGRDGKGRGPGDAAPGPEVLEEFRTLDKLRLIPGYWDRFRELLCRLEEHGCAWKLISLPHTWLSIPTYFALSRAELASSLHRYDGVTFGRRAAAVPSKWLQSTTRAESFGFQPKARILMGIHALRQKTAREQHHVSTDFLDLSKRARRLIHDDFEAVFRPRDGRGGMDVLLTPTTNLPAPPFGGVKDTVAEQRLDELTVPADLAGTPAISLPFGTVREVEPTAEPVFPEREAPELPCSIQLIGRRFHDALLLAAALRLEELVADWRQGR